MQLCQRSGPLRKETMPTFLEELLEEESVVRVRGYRGWGYKNQSQLTGLNRVRKGSTAERWTIRRQSSNKGGWESG